MNALVVRELESRFTALCELVPLKPVRTEDEYDEAVRALNALIDLGAGREGHPLADLLAAIGVLIGEYDDEHFPPQPVSDVDMLRFLMQQHGLKQGDLPEVGSQGVVSEILSGKRKLNRRQIAALKRRFGIRSDALF
jgi:HTH-type transcriptional regulator/antitoxin HigA